MELKIIGSTGDTHIFEVYSAGTKIDRMQAKGIMMDVSVIDMDCHKEKRTVFDVDDYFLWDYETVIILQRPTGIYFSAQVGGVGCEHPEVEGIPLKFWEYFDDINDCDYGCAWMGEEMKLKLATDLDIAFAKHCENMSYEIKFDYERIDELREGWWPVTIVGQLKWLNWMEVNDKAIIHTGNCD